jgi:polar amino acid transport system substrate-binding protein
MDFRALVRIVFVVLSVSGAVLAAQEKAVRLCADQWMPYNGDPAEARPGYVVELARTIYKAQGMAVDYTVVPWEEALAAVGEGRMHGAIGAGETECEGLTMPAEPVGQATMCLMTLAGSGWGYDNVASLRKVRLGVIEGYEYWPALDAYIAKGAGIVVATGEDPLGDLMAKLQAAEIDVLAENEPVLLWYLRSHEADRSKFRVVYKHVAEPVYVVFAPNDEGRRLASIFDEGMRALRASGDLERLLRRYGMIDWKPKG